MAYFIKTIERILLTRIIAPNLSICCHYWDHVGCVLLIQYGDAVLNIHVVLSELSLMILWKMERQGHLAKGILQNPLCRGKIYESGCAWILGIAH